MQKLTTIAKLARNSESLTEKTEAAIRSEIADAYSNGLAESGAIVRIGRRIFLDEDRYWAWHNTRAKVEKHRCETGDEATNEEPAV